MPKRRPRARNTDPESSKDAGRDIEPALEELWGWTIRAVGEMPGSTQRELGARFCPLDLRMLGRRLNEVDKVGVWRGPRRACTISGKNVETWWPWLVDGDGNRVPVEVKGPSGNGSASATP